MLGGGHILPSPGALLMIHAMELFGLVVVGFGLYCLYTGIKGWFK